MQLLNRLSFLIVIAFFSNDALAQRKSFPVKSITVDSGWAANSVNTVPFRKNALATWRNHQFISYYNTKGEVVVGKRKINSTKWILQVTPFKGNVRDAHNCISIMVDSRGFLHLAWDHHNSKLNYARSIKPGSLEMEIVSMVGQDEEHVTYPEFHKLEDGMLFLYRDGGSGKGNLMVNRYDVKRMRWSRLHNVLIDGEGQRNAYWQLYVDDNDVIHLSWVWRETPDVASNHDLCYARSRDGGKTWEDIKGKAYTLPITAATVSYAARIPMNSDLINQTSMSADANGNPFIATYWRTSKEAFPQYKIVYSVDGAWRIKDFAIRKENFQLSGGGTKRIPISRPQLAVTGKGNSVKTYFMFRDEARGNKLSLIEWKFSNDSYEVNDIDSTNLGQWEPSFDTELWRKRKRLNVFAQAVNQVDGEGLSTDTASMIRVLEINPLP